MRSRLGLTPIVNVSTMRLAVSHQLTYLLVNKSPHGPHLTHDLNAGERLYGQL